VFASPTLHTNVPLKTHEKIEVYLVIVEHFTWTIMQVYVVVLNMHMYVVVLEYKSLASEELATCSHYACQITQATSIKQGS